MFDNNFETDNYDLTSDSAHSLFESEGYSSSSNQITPRITTDNSAKELFA